MRWMSVPAATAAVLLAASSAVACPLCRSDTGRRVREGIFDNEFGGTLLAMLLPFLVISLVVAVIHGGPPWAGRSPAKPTHDARSETPDGGPDLTP